MNEGHTELAKQIAIATVSQLIAETNGLEKHEAETRVNAWASRSINLAGILLARIESQDTVKEQKSAGTQPKVRPIGRKKADKADGE